MAQPKTALVPALPQHAARVEISYDEAATRVLRQFRQVFNSVKKHFQQVEKSAGVGGAQVWALSVIDARPGIGVNDLALSMDVRQPTASNLVKSLVDQNLIEVRKSERDRRAVQLHLRPGGSRVLRRAPGPFAGVLPEALAGLSAERLHRLEIDLGALIAALDPDANSAAIPLGHL
ncbi:MAG: MarR family winged helix-turn-helix transcriptional regulator [Pseudomonadota bacterium]|nr:MarR family winged helix-turn-helix transcriptional regulator [Pseudomonadota bacterium]